MKRTYHPDGSAPPAGSIPVSLDGPDGIYFVTRDAQVWSLRAGRFLKQHVDGSGYQFVALYSGKRRSQPKVHRLVAAAFNAPENLEWVTPSQNIRHAFSMGLSSQKGERNAIAKLNDQSVRAIRARVANGELQKTLATEFGVSRGVVCNVVKNKIWSHVQ